MNMQKQKEMGRGTAYHCGERKRRKSGRKGEEEDEGGATEFLMARRQPKREAKGSQGVARARGGSTKAGGWGI